MRRIVLNLWRFLINISISLGAIILTLLIVEIALRIFYPTILHNQGLRSYNPKTGYTYAPNLNTFADVGKGPHKLITNEYGYIGKTFPMEKPKNEYRVANFGDSYVEGIQEVDWDKNFSALLSSYLEAHYNGAATTTPTSTLKFNSLNFGVAGRGQAEEYWTYKYLVSKASPDLNIVWFTIANDFSNNLVPPQSPSSLESNRMGTIKYILKKSALVNLLFEYLKDNYYFIKIMNTLHFSNAIVYKPSAGSEVDDGVDLAPKINYSTKTEVAKEQERAYRTTEELLNDFNNLSRENKSEFLVVIIPEPYTIYHQEGEFFKYYTKAKKEDYDFSKAEKKIKELLEKNKIAYLDLSDEFIQYSEGKSDIENCGNLFGDHFTACGHKVTTEIVGKYILENYLSK